METNNPIFRFIIIFTLIMVSVLIVVPPEEEKQGRLIKPFPKEYNPNPHPECDYCRAVYAYSLNVNNHHYGVKDSIE